MKNLATILIVLALALAARAESFTGTVKQTMDSGGYTYVLLKTAQGDVWVAGPESKTKVGQTLSTGEGMLMQGFNSKTLKRTFDKIYFVNSLGAAKGSAGAASGTGMTGNPHASGGMANPHAGMPLVGGTAPAASAPKPKAGSVKKATHTVSELFFQPKLLVGKTVEVRGVVTKVNEGIMGSNWIHLMDGTGQPGKDDLVITTSQTAKLGDRILAKGKVAVDRDLGSGYFFPVLLDQATLKVEGAAAPAKAAAKGKPAASAKAKQGTAAKGN
jgi:hypothetical protein